LVALLAASTLAGAEDPLQPPGTESHTYRELSPLPLRVYVWKPEGWKLSDRRAGFVWFFGSGSNPTNASAWAKRAAQLGMVAIAPDYREPSRANTLRKDAIADARAALHWIQEHAGELGIDPERVVVGGNSAGGRLALWTAITAPPPGSLSSESPLYKPAALLLTSPAFDMKPDPDDTDPTALSPVSHLDAKMPPTIIFHGDADDAVPYQKSVAMHAALAANGNICELVMIPRGSHAYGRDQPAWWPRTQQITVWFLEDLKLVAK
jgi:acetyl esterase/lipase